MTDQATPALPATGFLRQSHLLGNPAKGILPLIPFSAATLWRKVKAKKFPEPVKLSDNVTAWRVEDVRAWIENH